MKTTQGYILARRGRFWGRYQHNGKRFEFVLRDEMGRPVTTQRAAERALDIAMAPLRLKSAAERLAMYSIQAESLRDRIIKAENIAQRKTPLISNLKEIYIKAFCHDGELTNHNKNDLMHLDELAAYMTEHNIKSLVDFTNEQAIEQLAPFRNTPAAYNLRRALVLRIWRWLYDNGIIEKERCPYKATTPQKLRNKEKRLLNAGEVARIIEVAKGEYKILLTIGAMTGLRLKDAALLEWSSIDFENGVIRVEQAKIKHHGGKKARAIVGIPPQLAKILKAGAVLGRYVLPMVAEKYTRCPTATAEKCKSFFVKAGINDGTFHCLRHYYVSAMIAAGAPAEIVQKMAGHNSAAMTAHYTHVAADTARKYAEALSIG